MAALYWYTVRLERLDAFWRFLEQADIHQMIPCDNFAVQTHTMRFHTAATGD